MAERSPQEGLNRLEALIYPDLHRYVDPTSRAGLVAWGVFFTATQQICGVLRLHSGGFCFSAGPNRRTIIEYILFLCWLADDGEAAVDVLNRSLQNNQKMMSTRLQLASQLEKYPERAREILAQTIAEPLEPHPDERLLKPWNLIDEYDSTLKSYYAAESGFSHVSMMAIQFFMKQTDEATELSQTPVPAEPVPCTELCLHLLSQAMLAFNEILVDQPWTTPLAEIAAEYGLETQRPQRKAT